MRRKPQKKRDKPYFCVDNNLSLKFLNRYCNKFGIFHQVHQLLKKPNPKDPEIIKFCINQDYHVITNNKDNFKNFDRNSKIGIFYISSQNPDYWLDLFKSYMKTHPKHEDSYYKTISIEAKKINVISRKNASIFIQ